MNRLISARDLAERYGKATTTELILWLAERSRQRGRFRVMWDGVHVGGPPVIAYVDFGRWAAQCECGQGSYVDPESPFLFCPRCGNGNTGLARLVIFPPDEKRRMLEQLLMERPVIENQEAADRIEAARLAKPVYPYLLRSWHPSQSLEDLVAMNAMIGGK